MRNITVLFSILALILLAAGCKTSEPSGPSLSASFIGGTSAIKMQFLENAPPAEVTDKKGEGDTAEVFPFDAVVTVENIGEYSIPAAEMTVKLTGFFPADFGITDTDSLKQTYAQATGKTTDALPFRGVQKDPNGNRIQGDLQQFSFPFKTATQTAKTQFKYDKELAGNQQFPFRAEACYKYETTALSQICIKEKLTSKDNPVCNPSGSKPVSNSGAPVQVTSVMQSVGGQNKAILNFKVKQVGSGDVFRGIDEGGNKCNSDFKNEKRVKVTVDLGIPNTECLGLLEREATNLASGYLLLDNGEASFTCTVPTPVVDSLKTFDMTLVYYVKESITRNVLVKHLI